MEKASFDDIRKQIAEVASGLHSTGTFPPKVFDAIAEAAYANRGQNSAETGSGASTLLFSHLSQRHAAFAADGGSGSVTNVRRSPLLHPNVVTFVEGPTQLTLPQHRFTDKLQLVLLDGPHAYPFPDLEYYFVYPHLETGAILILDDIHIPTVHNLFKFLREDAMFELDKVVQTTAFFTRSDAPTFDPFGDGWSQQSYNAKLPLRYTWRDKVRALLPASTRRKLSRRTSQTDVRILAPLNGTFVGETGIVEGSAEASAHSYLWVLVRRNDFDGWWPQGAGAVRVDQSRWRVSVKYGESQDSGHDFEIATLIVGRPTHDLWTDWVARVEETGLFPPVPLPPASAVLGEAFVTVRTSDTR